MFALVKQTWSDCDLVRSLVMEALCLLVENLKYCSPVLLGNVDQRLATSTLISQYGRYL